MLSFWLIFWSAIFILSIVGILVVLLNKNFQSNVLETDSNEAHLPDADLQSTLDGVKNVVRKVTSSSKESVRDVLRRIYIKSASKVRGTKISDLVKGKGLLKKRDTTSGFLRDVKEHRDKVREELVNGNGHVEE